MDSLGPLMMPNAGALFDPHALGSHGNDIHTVAQGFESMFASLLVKQMRQTLEPDTMFGKDNGDVLGGLFDHFMGQHLAQTGGLGIGAFVTKHMPQARVNNERANGTGAHR
jgi:Rod binding domain-containing protein